MMHTNTHADFYLSLNGIIVPNNGYVDISNIGSYSNSLQCHYPDRNRFCDSQIDWFAPDGTRVNNGVPGLYTENHYHYYHYYRNYLVLALEQTYTATPQRGIYSCSVDNSALTTRTIYVGLYNNGEGILLAKYIFTLLYFKYRSN